VTLAKEDALLWVGKVVKTQGIKGEVRVLTGGENAGTFREGNAVYLEDGQGRRKTLTVQSSRLHRRLTIISFREIKRIEEAEELVGCSVFINKENLQDLPPDEFYWHQLIGLQVRTEEGLDVGTLEEVFSTGSNDVFVVRKKGQEVLIPATDEVVRKIDLDGKTLVIRPLEGLLPEDDL
jgi:16S rRNA processing protein RimM